MKKIFFFFFLVGMWRELFLEEKSMQECVFRIVDL